MTAAERGGFKDGDKVRWMGEVAGTVRLLPDGFPFYHRPGDPESFFRHQADVYVFVRKDDGSAAGYPPHGLERIEE